MIGSEEVGWIAAFNVCDEIEEGNDKAMLDY